MRGPSIARLVLEGASIGSAELVAFPDCIAQTVEGPRGLVLAPKAGESSDLHSTSNRSIREKKN